MRINTDLSKIIDEQCKEEIDSRPYVIAVDFDDCLFYDAWPNVGKPIVENIKRLKERQKEKAAEIILWTCREGKELDAAIKACKEFNIHFSAVNNNLPCYVDEFGGDCRKIFANEYWDDKAFNISPKNQIYSDAVFVFGQNQMIKAVEELSELIHAIIRIRLSDRPDFCNAAEEIIDVRIMLNQLEILISEYYDSGFAYKLEFYDKLKHTKLRYLTQGL